MTHQLAIGVAIRQDFRDKKVINILYGFGVSVEYTRLLRLETQLASTVLERMLLNGGLYIHTSCIVFFAVDNVNFAEDTPDGQNILHATALAIYQRKLPDDPPARIDITGQTQDR